MMKQKKKRGSFIRKFRKQNKPLRILFLIIGILYIISLFFFTKALIHLKGIETFIRILILVILYIYLFVYCFVGILLLFTGKNKRFIALLVIGAILSPIMFFTSYHINKAYGIIDNAQKKYITYKSYMVSMNETEKYNKIGMIKDKTDPTGYIIPKKMIKKFDIKGEIVKYDDYISMTSDMYDGVIDAMFVADGYVTLFNSYEKFENIEYETKVVYELSKKLENKDNISYSTKDLTEPFTILLMGVDATGDGISSASSFNGDSLMLITFNPKTLSATVFSIPRDTYVPIACRGDKEDKINSSAYGGTTCVVNTIQNLTGIDIDYYVKINFTGVVKLVDDLGGIEVDVPIEFCEQDSQRRFDDHLICLKKGYQKLNGEQALAFSRHRKTLLLGDFQRVQHQQMVVEAMVTALKNTKSVDSFYKIMGDVVNNIDTNMSTEQILSLYKVAKNILTNKLGENTKLSIQKTYLTGYDLTMFLPNTKSYAYTFQYYKQSLDSIVEAMEVNLEIKKPKLVKNFSFNVNEVYEPEVIGKTYYNEDRKKLMPNLVGQNRSYVEAWSLETGIKVNYTEIKEGNSSYSDALPDGYVLTQSIRTGELLESIKSIDVSVIKKTVENNTETTDNKKENTETKQNQPEIDTKIEDTDKKETEQKSSEDETVPNFVGKTISEFDKWKSSLKNVNITFDKVALTPEKIIELGIEMPVQNTIYEQSTTGIKIKDASSITVYYYAGEN